MTPHEKHGDSVGGELTVEAAEVFHGDLAVAPDRRDYGEHLHTHTPQGHQHTVTTLGNTNFFKKFNDKKLFVFLPLMTTIIILHLFRVESHLLPPEAPVCHP